MTTAQVGEVLAWRNPLRGLTDADGPVHRFPWIPRATFCRISTTVWPYRVMSSMAYPKVKEIIQNTLASALDLSPSSGLDLKVPELTVSGSVRTGVQRLHR